MKARPATVGALLLVVGAFVALGAVAMSSAVVYYVTPTELAARPSADAVRLYGVVVPGSVRLDAGSGEIVFAVTDGTTTTDVSTRSTPTALFRDGVAVILPGRTTADGRFAADELLVKHSEVYDPLLPGETMPPGLLDEIRATEP